MPAQGNAEGAEAANREGSASIRVGAYVDGFNLYYGLMAKGLGRYRWLDIRELVERFIRPPQELVVVRYFTARPSHPPDRYRRHTTYLNVLRRARAIEISEGKIEGRPRRCLVCGARHTHPQEKQTDVNMAVQMLTDAVDGRIDEAFLLCADSDLVPAVASLEHRGIPVTHLVPPGRHSDELSRAAHRRLHIDTRHIRQCQLPNPVEYTHRGKPRAIYRPDLWQSGERGPDQ